MARSLRLQGPKTATSDTSHSFHFFEKNETFQTCTRIHCPVWIAHSYEMTDQRRVHEPAVQHSNNDELYRLQSFTCTYNADRGTVKCLPFVRTFRKSSVDGTMREITHEVNGPGNRLPLGSRGVEETM